MDYFARHTPNAPQVSVLLPVWNAEATLAAALNSLLAQTHSSFEIVAVDDGSTDATPAILARYAAQYPQLRVLSVPHGGIVAALNTGLDVARGEYIARMDADDISFPTRLATQAAFLDAHPDLGLVGCTVRFGGDRSASAGYARYVDWTNTLLTHDQIALERFRESPFAHPSVMFRASLVQQHGGYAEGCFPEDYELWLRWLEKGVRMAKVVGGQACDCFLPPAVGEGGCSFLPPAGKGLEAPCIPHRTVRETTCGGSAEERASVGFDEGQCARREAGDLPVGAFAGACVSEAERGGCGHGAGEDCPESGKREVGDGATDNALLLWNDPPDRLSRTDERCSVENFYGMKTEYLARWLERHNPTHPHLTVIGAGKMSRRRAVMLREHGVVIDAWIDVDPRKIGNIVDGVRVKGREALPQAGTGFCLAYLAGHGAAEELEEFLTSIGYVKGRDFLLAS